MDGCGPSKVSCSFAGFPLLVFCLFLLARIGPCYFSIQPGSQEKKKKKDKKDQDEDADESGR